MKKILVTGGTVFVSKYVAKYYADKGYEVYVLNRGTKPQIDGVKLLKADRKNIGDILKSIHFDIVFNITSYDKDDIVNLTNALGSYDDYIMISSSAVYMETSPQPFVEEQEPGLNKFWGAYGVGKIEAEKALLAINPNAYIIRPPYLYGPMNNVYREGFVFDCAMQDRQFALPKDGSMKMQFFHVKDLCRFMDAILQKKPDNHIFNVGNKETVSIKEWVKMCYEVAGKEVIFKEIEEKVPQRNYFCFADYEYYLDVTKQFELIDETIDMKEGLKESFDWYVENRNDVNRKNYVDYIDEFLI